MRRFLMMNITLYDCAATYLYSAPMQRKVEPKKTERKVEAVLPAHSGKRFNPNAGTLANHSHIDILI